jgi:hypothetical protein
MTYPVFISSTHIDDGVSVIDNYDDNLLRWLIRRGLDLLLSRLQSLTFTINYNNSQ